MAGGVNKTFVELIIHCAAEGGGGGGGGGEG